MAAESCRPAEGKEGAEERHVSHSIRATDCFRIYLDRVCSFLLVFVQVMAQGLQHRFKIYGFGSNPTHPCRESCASSLRLQKQQGVDPC